MQWISRKNKSEPISDDVEFVETFGGCVGRIASDDHPNHKRIAIFFKDAYDNESPVYILNPGAARFAGWNLFRRGVVDGIKLRLAMPLLILSVLKNIIFKIKRRRSNENDYCSG